MAKPQKVIIIPLKAGVVDEKGKPLPEGGAPHVYSPYWHGQFKLGRIRVVSPEQKAADDQAEKQRQEAEARARAEIRAEVEKELRPLVEAEVRAEMEARAGAAKKNSGDKK